MDAFDLRQWPGFIAAGGNPAIPAMIDQVTIDSRRIDSTQSLFIALAGKHSDGHHFIPQAIKSGAGFILARTDWNSTQNTANAVILRVENPLLALQQIAKCYRQQLPGKIIAIGGSYGKTMVKDLLQSMIATSKTVAVSPESFNSQIGAALSLFTVQKHHEIAIIEASISECNEMDKLADMIMPDHTIITHIGKKHLATLGDMKTTAAEIIKLSLATPVSHWNLIPKDAYLTPHSPFFTTPPHFWNQKEQKLPQATSSEGSHGGNMPYKIIFPDGNYYSGQTTFGFYYFLDLVNITVKAAWLLGISSTSICSILDQYTAEPMRTEIWRSPIGATFINDIYCSDPQSIEKSMKHLQTSSQGRKAFIFGGMRGPQHHADSDYRLIGRIINQAKINRLVLVGPYPFSSLIEEVQKQSPTTEILYCNTHEEAIEKIRYWVTQDDIVLIKGTKKIPLDDLTEAFHDSIFNNQCLINLAAIESNIATIRKKLAPKTRMLVMIKALAYGTNDIRMGQFLNSCGIDILGVSYTDEGVALKRAGITQAIFVISTAAYEAAKVVKWDLEVGVSEKALITALSEEAVRQNKKVKLHLHVDTGMSRFGCRPEEALTLAQYIQSLPGLILDGIMTHFACADDPASDAFTVTQANCFEQVIKQIKNAGIDIPWCHAANSSAVMRFNFPQFNMVRLGLAVYGLYPSEATKQSMDLRLALSLVSRVVGINLCREGETISYGRSYTVKRHEQRIAVLPIGYFDGLHRNYSGKGSVMIRGKKAPMVGKICMDFMMVDITDIPNVAIGDSVLIFGEDEYGHYVSPEELAASGDSIIYELITCLGPRIQRIFIHEEAYQLR